MLEKLQDNAINILAALIIFASGYFIHGFLNRSAHTTIVGKTIEFSIAGYVDNIPKETDTQKKPLSKDSAKVRIQRNDSIQTLIAKGDTSASADSVRAEYIHPYQIIVRDSLTINWVTIDPLAPMQSRATTDSTQYLPIKLTFTYLDTTVNVTSGISLQTYATVAGGAAIGAAVANVPGAGIGAVVGLLIDELF